MAATNSPVDDVADEHTEAHLPGVLAADFSFGAAISFGDVDPSTGSGS